MHWRLNPRRSGKPTPALDGLGLRVLDLGDSQPPEWPKWRIPGDGHPDPRAHAVAAKLIAAELEDLGWRASGQATAAGTP